MTFKFLTSHTASRADSGTYLLISCTAAELQKKSMCVHHRWTHCGQLPVVSLDTVFFSKHSNRTIKKCTKSRRNIKAKNSSSLVKGMVNLSLINWTNIGASYFSDNCASVFSLLKRARQQGAGITWSSLPFGFICLNCLLRFPRSLPHAALSPNLSCHRERVLSFLRSKTFLL